MRLKKSSVIQISVILLIVTFSLSNWGYSLLAQANFNHFESEPPEIHKSMQDTSHVLNMSEIPIIKETSSKKEKEKSISNSDNFFENRGYMSFVSIGLLPGSQDIIAITPVSLDMSHGFYNAAGTYIGAGLAVETFDPALMPIFGDLRFFLSKGNAKPWIRVTLGYSIPISSRPNFNEKGGIIAGIGSGMIFSISSRAAFYFYLGYRFQKLISTSTDYNGHETKLITEFNRMEFRLGLSFH